MAIAGSIWRLRTREATPSRFCGALALAALSRRLTLARAAGHAQLQWATSMVIAGLIWRRRTILASPSRFCGALARVALDRRTTLARACGQNHSGWAIS